MSNNLHWTPEQLKKLGLIEKDGQYVKASSLVAKGKVEKLPGLIEQMLPIVDQQTEAFFKMKLLAEQGIMFVSAMPQFILPNREVIYPKHTFAISPMPAPRMVQSDKWAKRASVMKYFAWRTEFILQSNKVGYSLRETLRIVFVFPFPKSFSKNKKAALFGQPHKQRPDVDNCCKSVLDAFGVDDGYVYDIRAVKVWGESGKIIIF